MENLKESYICKDENGNILLAIEDISEYELSQSPLLTHCLAIVKTKNDYLLGWNKWRKRYEIFGGCIEKGETARNCIVRECYEELGLKDVNITYLGAMKLLLKSDYFSAKERIEYGGLYGISLLEIASEDINKQIQDRNEIDKVSFYSQIKNEQSIAAIDEKLLEYFA